MTWTAAFENIKEMSDKIHKIEEVSGHDIDTLISLFESGYTLNIPDVNTVDRVCETCRGSGYVLIAPGVRGLRRCPKCNPFGNK